MPLKLLGMNRVKTGLGSNMLELVYFKLGMMMDITILNNVVPT